MVYKSLFFVLILFLFSGCEPKPEPDTVYIKIENISIGIKEFEQAYAMAQISGSPETRAEFTERLITERILLAEAEKVGLDKNEQFLKDVENFWQRSLLKLVIDRRVNHIASTVKVTDDETFAYYQSHQADFGESTYDDKKEKIRMIIGRDKQEAELKKWMDDLRTQAKVKINHKLENKTEG